MRAWVWYFFMVVFVLVGTPEAFAKKVVLEWKPKAGAIGYELKITQNGKTTLTKKLEDNEWTGDIEPGVYSYQLRSIDKLKRAGDWSTPNSLVVTPKPPEVSAPGSGGSVSLYDPTAHTKLSWKPTPGAQKYKVTVRSKGKKIYEKQVSGTQVEVASLPPGTYSMQVTGMVEAKGSEVKAWESKPSDPVDFSVENKKLEVPIALSPLGKIPPPKDHKIEFKWKKVDGAEAYEFTLIEPSKSRSPAGSLLASTTHKFTTRDTKIIVEIPHDGKFQWKVRALANYTAQSTPDAVGPESIAIADLDRNASYFDGAGYLALSTMIAPYNYKFQNQNNSVSSNGTISSAQTTLRVSGEYYFRPEWGVGAAFENTQFSANSANFGRNQLEAQIKYRWKLTPSRYAWFFQTKIGLESRDYVNLSQDSSGAPIGNTFNAVGPTVGFDIRKQLNDRFSLGIKADYFLPVALAGSVSYQGITGEYSYRNVSLGVQGLYWLSTNWGLGAGVYLDDRSISYSPTTPATGIAPTNDSVVADSVNFFASLIFSFGR